LEPGHGRNACSTKRAISIALKPNVDAIDVKYMATAWYYSQLLVLLKFVQANGTFAKASFAEASVAFFLELHYWD